MYEAMESLGIDYKFYEAVIMILLLLIGGLFGAVIAGGKRPSSDPQTRATFPRGRGKASEGMQAKPELPTIGSVRHGQKVVIDGVEWTIM